MQNNVRPRSWVLPKSLQGGPGQLDIGQNGLGLPMPIYKICTAVGRRLAEQAMA